MRVFAPVCFAGALLLAGCASQSTSSSSGEQGLFGAIWNSKLNPFAPETKPEESADHSGAGLKNLVVQVSIEPKAPKLSEDRVMNVSLRINNKAKRRTQIIFPTTQRAEAVIKDKSGKVIERWSEDHSFENAPGVVAINSGERAEYNLSVATREMTAGETYTVEAYVSGHESMKGSATVTPQK